MNKGKVTSIIQLVGVLVTGLVSIVSVLGNSYAPWIIGAFAALLVLSIVVVFLTYYKNDDKKIDSCLEKQAEIDIILMRELKAEQFRLFEDEARQLNDRLLDLFTDSLLEYCDDQGIEIATFVKRSDPALFYEQVLDRFYIDAKGEIKIAIDINGLDQKEGRQWEKYKARKLNQFMKLLEEAHCLKYSDSICLLPLKVFIDKKKKEIDSFCDRTFAKIFDDIREISIKCHEEVERLTVEIKQLKS